MNMIEKAIAFALEAHNGQKRKQSNLPYILHPLEAAVISQRICDDEEVITATILHDVIEDSECDFDTIKELFGEKTAILVEIASEDKMNEIPATESWEARKKETIKKLRHIDKSAKTVILSDKLSNMRSIHHDYIMFGDELWMRFNQTDKAKHEWYYRSILGEMREFSDTYEFHEYSHLIDIVFGQNNKKM